MRYRVPEYLVIDPKRTAEALESFLRSYVEASGASGVVLGLSGGTDSSVLAALAVKVLRPERVVALVMPDIESSRQSLRDAEEVAELLGLRVLKVDITSGVEFVLRSFGEDYAIAPRIAKGNVKARLRMVLLYYLANRYNMLVLGPSDRSEWLLGYFTKWGDGAADIYPFLNLYKTQVRLLGDYLGVPEYICWKPSSPDLWSGQRASDELGADYDIIDPVLYHYVELGLSIGEVSRILGVSEALVRSIVGRISSSEHKRKLVVGPPPVR